MNYDYLGDLAPLLLSRADIISTVDHLACIAVAKKLCFVQAELHFRLLFLAKSIVSVLPLVAAERPLRVIGSNSPVLVECAEQQICCKAACVCVRARGCMLLEHFPENKVLLSSCKT